MYVNPKSSKVFIEEAIREAGAKTISKMYYTATTGQLLEADIFAFQSLDSLSLGDTFDLTIESSFAIDLSVPPRQATRRLTVTLRPEDKFLHVVGGPGWRVGIIIRGVRAAD